VSQDEEGLFTKDGGGQDQFQDRVQSQKEIKIYLNEIFTMMRLPSEQLNLE
jgi:hypothetical protein